MNILLKNLKEYTGIVIFCLCIIFMAKSQESLGVQDSALTKTNASSSTLVGVALGTHGLFNSLNISPFEGVTGDNILMIKCRHSEKYAGRLGIGINYMGFSYSAVDSLDAAQVLKDSTSKRFDFSITPGIEKHYKTNNKLDPYLGFELALTKIGQERNNSTTTTNDTTGTGTYTVTYTIDGGWSVGANLISGFNYFFTDNLALGLELGFGLNSIFTGGDWSEVVIDNPVSGSNTVTRNVGSEFTRENNLKLNNSALLTLSWFMQCY